MTRRAKPRARPAIPGGPSLNRNASVTFSLIAISNKLVASASQAYMRHHRIGIMEWRVMALIAADRDITARDVTRLSGVTAGSVSRAIHSLARRGLLEVNDDVADNRRSLLRLTAAGAALHNRVIVDSLAREKLLLRGFSRAEYRALLGAFRRLMENVALVDAYDPGRRPEK